MEAGSLADTEGHRAALPLNTMTWRLCGFNCTSNTMSVYAALERATKNLNNNDLVAGVLTEESTLWMEMLHSTVHDASQV